ncbi:hypothetical protein ACFU6I_22800 [Streptomyces sp. NPDC057486]|uniref:hypothetical protein n=1 Tax=Streptomyces sp. NPDC057486 TaxID=3346145 RepID=UPI003690AD57
MPSTLTSAPQTNDDPIAGGTGFVILGVLVVAFGLCARWRRWKLPTEGSYSARAAIMQGTASVVFGLGLLLYGYASR